MPPTKPMALKTNIKKVFVSGRTNKLPCSYGENIDNEQDLTLRNNTIFDSFGYQSYLEDLHLVNNDDFTQIVHLELNNKLGNGFKSYGPFTLFPGYTLTYSPLTGFIILDENLNNTQIRIYPEAGIMTSNGTSYGPSIVNNSVNWNDAYSWGDHNVMGYATESWVSQEIANATPNITYPGVGIPLSTGSGWGTSIVDNSTDWNEAFSWGNHALAGYGTSNFNPTNLLTDYGFTDNSANWDTAFSWGDHASAGYALSSSLSGYVPYTGATADLLMGATRRIGINSTDFGSGGHTFGLSVGGNIKASRIYSNIFRDETSGNTWVSVTGTAPNQVLALGNASISSITNGQTWAGGAGITYTALDINITDTSSAAGSMFLNLRKDGTSQLSISKFGQFTVANNPTISHGSGNFSVIHGGVQHIRSSNSGTLIGTGGNATARLEVRGDSASTGSTFLLRNSTPTTLFEQFNNGEVEFRGSGSVTMHKGLKIGNTGATSVGGLISDTSSTGSGVGYGFNIWMNGNGRIHAGNTGSSFYNNASSDVSFGRHAANTWGIYQGQLSTLLGQLIMGDNLTIARSSVTAQRIELIPNDSTVSVLIKGGGNDKPFYITSWANGGTAQPLYFGTGYVSGLSEVRMTIGITGNVGIGTTNPSQALHVVGDILIGNYTASTNVLRWANINNAGNSAFMGRSVAAQFHLSAGSVDEFRIDVPSGADTHRLNFTGSGGSTMALYRNARVRIGNASVSVNPSATLEVRGESATVGNAFLVQNSTPTDLFTVDNTGKIGLRPTNFELWFGTIGNAGYANLKQVSGILTLQTPNNSSIINLNGGVIGDYLTGANVYGVNITNVVNSRTIAGTYSLLRLFQYITQTSGISNTNFLEISGTIQQTGGANGITRGILISPTLTAAADFRAIEAVSRNNANDTLIRLTNGTQDVFCVKGDNKIGMYGAGPTDQGNTSLPGTAIAFGGGTPIDDLATFDGYTIAQVVAQLRNMGILQ
jgi:hypothetical protein